MNIQSAIRTVTEHRDLSAAEMTEVMHAIMGGQATPAQIAGFLIGLRMKGETVEEIAAAVQVMRALATKVEVGGEYLVDTCGTGGDGASTFNISTAAAFVAAAAGARVAKHGNRSVSSRCGSADVLEAAGVKLDLSPQQVAQCVNELGAGFMFAPNHHGAMKHTIAPRREMGVRTLFNLLGPLTNPANAPQQVLGVFDAAWLEPVAEVLGQLGSRHVLVVHARDGLDEISISAATQLAELKDGEITRQIICPEQFGMARADMAELRVDTPAQSLALINAVLSGTPGAALDIVVLNAGAAIYVAGVAASLEDGVARAQTAIATGAARARFAAFIEFTNSFSNSADSHVPAA